MQEKVKYELKEFISELSQVTFSDPLIHVESSNKSFYYIDYQIENKFTVEITSKLNQLLNIATNYKKTSDIHSLCLVIKTITWTYHSKEITSPLLLIPLHFKKNRLSQQVNFEFDLNDVFINPFLLNIFKKEFDYIDFDANFEENYRNLIQLFEEKLTSFEIKELNILGNFHHHRFEIVKDLEEIESSENHNNLVKILLGHNEKAEEKAFKLSSKNCFESDNDQLEVINLFQKDNLVLQGPPGTGKSQVLASLLTKLLKEDSSQLLISEKKSALGVIKKKLETVYLHHFAFVFSSNTKNGDFVKHLKTTWNLLENYNQKAERNLLRSEQLKSEIEITISKLRKTNVFGALPISHFHGLEKQNDFNELPYLSQLLDYESWCANKTKMLELFQTSIPFPLLTKIAPGSFLKIENFDLVINDLLKLLKEVNLHIKVHSIADIDINLKKVARIQLLENEKNKASFKLLNSKTGQKRFLKLKDNYFKHLNSISFLEIEKSNWKEQLSLSQIQSYLFGLRELSWFKKRKLIQEIKKKLTHKELDILISLNNLEKLIMEENSLIKIKNELIDFGIYSPENELNVTAYVLNKLEEIEENELNQLLKLNSTEISNHLGNLEKLQKINSCIKSYFTISENESLLDFLQTLNENIGKIIPLKKNLVSLPFNLLRIFYYAKSFEEAELLVQKSNWVKFKALFPELASFNGGELEHKLDNLIQEESNEHEQFSNELKQIRKNKFEYYHTLLSTSNSKLSPEEKEIKRQLKIGKAILVKEFAKSKQHKSLRELVNSEAKIWINLLNPIHLSTPTMVSKNYPLKTDLFECILFDESSQLILPKAITCVQRGKRMLIAGDSQQMSPTNFFKGKINSIDLLHQASYYLPNHMLKHHYRSQHSELISFSNEHFYENQLIVYPTANKIELPIEFHLIPNGVFQNRMNEIEAKELAKTLEKLIKTTKDIGVVAFSETQLQCIIHSIDKSYYDLIESKIRKNELFFKSLEQVQGDECSILLISLGYGKDENGRFYHRFGPLSQGNGTKRLNVLFTRAKEKIHFFSSVKSSEFNLSTNEAVNLLAKYIRSIEQKKELESYIFPHNIEVERNKDELIVKNFHKHFDSADDLKVFHKIIKSRNWKLKYEI